MQTLPQEEPKTQFELKKLKPRHKQAASLLAQGLGRAEVAEAIGCTPEYITMLCQQTLFIEHMEELEKVVRVRMQAMMETSADVVGLALRGGSIKERLEAAKMVFTARGLDKPSATSAKFVLRVPSKFSSSQEWEDQHSGLTVAGELSVST